jgi:uncharacterized glyoxalase superfamily protein PhnB
MTKAQFKYTILYVKDVVATVEFYTKAFVSENIEETWQQAISAGATVLEPIETKVWGQQVGYLRDPNGFLLEICTPMEM